MSAEATLLPVTELEVRQEIAAKLRELKALRKIARALGEFEEESHHAARSRALLSEVAD